MILSIAGICGWLIVCAGQAVLAKFAETYFKNKLQAGTPFTLGRREGAAALDLSFDNGASIVLGVMFLPGSLLCRYGAELTQQDA